MTATMRDPERDPLDMRPTVKGMPGQVRSDYASGVGRLRVYVGMAPGVGKTYRMLEEGHRRVARGTDVVVGFAEPHGRPQTMERLAGLEIVPRRRIDYRGVVVEEMDADAVIERAPTVALVDEIAHTNIPGSMHVKRWEDMERIRDAGIHVVSTLNVQHLESMADAVATITGAAVNERLPDKVLLRADEIEIVDMSPHALRQRMRHGNVYPPDRTRIALDQHFTEANLTALRELALRFVAQRVEGELEDAMAGEDLPLVTERVVVLVDGSRASQRALRRAAALAGAIRGALIAAVVETPHSDRQPIGRRRDIEEMVDEAIDLGAEVARIESDDLASGLARIARRRRATHLVIPFRGTGGINRLLQRPLAEQLLERIPELEVHVVGAGPAPAR